MHGFVEKVARYLAVLGGLVLTTIIIVTCISVGKRAIGLNPILGDYEITEAGMAFAIMAFFPWCQFNRAHATVDIATDFLSKRAQRFLAMIWEIIFAIVMVLISWRLFHGMLDKYSYGETTFLLQFPIWWSYAGVFVASIAACLVGFWMVIERVQEFLNPELSYSKGQGAVH